jgi:hypothetical protein
MIDNNKPTSNHDIIKEIIAISNLLLYFKLLLFLRVFRSFGIYFAIIIGVPKKVFPFLVVLLFVFLGFAHAFFVLLKASEPQPTFNSSSIPLVFDNESDNPWNTATQFRPVYENGTIGSTSTYVELTHEENHFEEFGGSLLTTFFILVGK